MIDRVLKLGVSMRMRSLQVLKMRDGRADERLQMSDVHMIFMVMADMRMSMIRHLNGMVAMKRMIDMNFVRHELIFLRLSHTSRLSGVLSHCCGRSAAHGWLWLALRSGRSSSSSSAHTGCYGYARWSCASRSALPGCSSLGRTGETRAPMDTRGLEVVKAMLIIQ